MDEVVSEMETYNLFKRNYYQKFFNELLMKLGKNESPTTFSLDTIEENYDCIVSQDFDMLNKVIPVHNLIIKS